MPFIQNKYIGETVELAWDNKKNYSRWLIGYKKRSIWFWKNYFLINNKGSIILLIDQSNFVVRIYSIRFVLLKKILEYEPNVVKLTLHSLDNTFNIQDPKINNKFKFKLKMNSNCNQPIGVDSKVILPYSQLNIPYLKQKKWKM